MPTRDTTLSFHLIDLESGAGWAGASIRAVWVDDSGTTTILDAVTDARGRADLKLLELSENCSVRVTYNLASGSHPFFEEVSLLLAPFSERRVHIPLLIAPYGVTVYRGVLQ